jgi:hypothetical protein
MTGDDRQTLKIAVCRNQELRDRVTREVLKRPDVAVNQVMRIIAEYYADGVSDGDAFGARTLVADILRAAGEAPGDG